MKLKDLLEVLSKNLPFVIGTINGEGWIIYNNVNERKKIPYFLLDKEVLNILKRDGEATDKLPEMKGGIGIIVEGKEDGLY